MDLISRIIEARDCGETVAGSYAGAVGSVAEAAARFGLRSEHGIFRRIGRDEARAVLVEVLIGDMAYGTEVMAPEQAGAYADEFLQAYADGSSRYFTNGTYGQPRMSPDEGPEWMPATDATFDTGVLILSADRIACLWFLEED